MPGSARVWRTPLVILGAAILVILVINGIRGSLGIFLRPVSDDLGWGREVFAFAIAVQNLVWGASQPFLAALSDRYGSGRVIGVSTVLYALGLVLMAESTSPLGIVLSGGLLLGIGLSGTGFAIVLSVVGRSVPESRRSLYLGFAAAGGSAGQFLMVPIGQLLIDAGGWASALVAFALATIVLIPLAAALSGRASDGDTGAIGRQSLGEAVREAGRHRGFLLLTAGFFVCGFHVTFIGTHLHAYVMDEGLSATIGAAALAVIGIGNIVGSLGCGYLGGVYRKKHVLAGVYLARSLVISLFVLVPISETTVLLFAFAIGLLWLGTVPVTSGLVAQIFGLRYMATLFGVVFFGHQIGSFAGVWLGGRLFDATGSYDVAWWASIGLGIFAAAVHLAIRDEALPRLAAAAARG